MTKYYIAVTYDVCEHNDLCEDMNRYLIRLSDDIEKEIKEFAKQDIAPIVRIYESDTREYSELRLYKEYKFKEFECSC